jgi:FixJ family two-component response regulator
MASTALLDVNLNGTLSFPIADELGERGIPFIFCTGYSDGVDAYLRASEISVVDKPIRPRNLLNAVLSAVNH